MGKALFRSTVAAVLLQHVCGVHLVGVGTARVRERQRTRGAGAQEKVRRLSQPLDHFDHLLEPKVSWQQRYWLNDTFFNAATGPVFLCVGGEARPMDDDIVVSGQEHCALMMRAAAEHHALVLALEHRFYNPPDEYPVPDLSTKYLRFLSSEQALADLAAFVAHVTAELGLSPGNRWVTWGGSYPGMMASFARYKYPHLIFASVASSAPVAPILNMQGYNAVVATAIAEPLIGGSPECLDTVRDIFAAVGEALATIEGRADLYQQFAVCGADGDPLALPANADEFTMDLSFLVYSQMNDPASPEPTENLAVTCRDFLLNAALGSPMERLASLNRRGRDSEACLGVSYKENQVDAYADVALTGFSDTSTFCERCWLFQTCTEFGFYQTCDPGTGCPFTSDPWLNRLDRQVALCNSSFGIQPDEVAGHVAFSMANYGGRHADTRRILYVNGGVDPWRAQSALKPRPGLPALEVPGASHHPWTHPPLTSDQPSVRAAREKILYQVSEWLAEAPAPVMGPVSDTSGGELEEAAPLATL